MADTAPDDRKRRMLQQWFEQGSKMMAGGQYDYATEMFTRCVMGDPSNAIYVTNFLANLQKKYGNDKKGSSLAGMRSMGSKASMQKAKLGKNWLGVIESGLECLKLNPWDIGALLSIAEACAQLEYDEAIVAYLRLALEVDRANLEVNRVLARAYERLSEFDKAIECWQRVKKAKPNDDEANKGISSCTVKRTMKKGNYDTATTSTDVMKDKQAQDERRGGLQQSEEQKLEKEIKKKPDDLGLYVQLSDLYSRNERYDEAEAVLQRALKAAGGSDIGIRERLEDTRLRRLREELAQAEQRLKSEPTDDAKSEFEQKQAAFNQAELEYYLGRAERYPQNLALKFELAVRLQRLGKFNEAIKAFQEARSDPQRKGEVLLHLGECFQAIRQYKLAMTHFEDALEELAERNVEARKRALYSAGKLAKDMKNYEKAEDHLNTLAGLDFAYRDVADMLEEIRRLREEAEEQQG
jgi:tetratricopeptide (TPR) repeat protein